VNPPPDQVAVAAGADTADADDAADADNDAGAAPADARIAEPVAGDPWRDVVDQRASVRLLEAATRAPVHAYLLTGPPGSGKRALARGFAAELLAAGSTGEARERHVRLALAEQHPDMRVVEPEGMTFRKGDAERMVRHATLAPVEGERKVVVALGCEEIEDEAAGYLLKIVEEPPPSTVFVLLATEVLPELVTIASRCARVELGPLAATSIAARLVTEGVSPDRAQAAAAAAAGDLERARTLANDDRLVLRHRAWREAPRRLDGTGYRAAGLVAELQSMIAEALGPLQERQASEAAALEEQIERFGLRGAGKREVEARHKREVRRFRAAELRFGLATLATAYRDALAAEGTDVAAASLVAAAARIDEAGVALARYPNETLLLQALMARLPPLPQR
jgi:DNA polymerase III subunit delta'